MTNEENTAIVLAIIEQDPNTSVREIARIMRTNAEDTQQQLEEAGFETVQDATPSPSSVHRILKVNFKNHLFLNKFLVNEFSSVQNENHSRVDSN